MLVCMPTVSAYFNSVTGIERQVSHELTAIVLEELSYNYLCGVRGRGIDLIGIAYGKQAKQYYAMIYMSWNARHTHITMCNLVTISISYTSWLNS